MKTLKEVKAELREEIRELKPVIKELKKEEGSGIDTRGYQHKSSKYEMMRELEVQVDTLKRVYDMIKTVRKLR